MAISDGGVTVANWCTSIGACTRVSAMGGSIVTASDKRTSPRNTPKLTKPQSELIDLMERTGVKPEYEVMPGSVVYLPDHDLAWRKAHGGKPVMIDTLNSMVSKGVLRRVDLSPIYGRKRWAWELIG